MNKVEGQSVEPCLQLPPTWQSLGHAFVHQAKIQPHAPAISDSTGVTLSYHETLLRSLALANLLATEVETTEYVGILLPPSAGAALVNLALTFLGKVPVNLNYSMGRECFESCVKQSGITQIVTTKRLIDRMPFFPTAQLLWAESFESKISPITKLSSLCETDLVPEKLLGIFLPGLAGSHDSVLDRVASVVFTAGSTGDPKGAMLTHRNLLSNIQAIEIQADLAQRETVLGIVPFFHSFGFTLTLWAVLVLGHHAVYHYDPFDARRIGKLCSRFKPTVLFCTPTIMRGLLKRCPHEALRSLRICVLGGEKLSPELSHEMRSTLGIAPLQGYGMTETSPVISCNLPHDIVTADGRTICGNREETVGVPMPGTSIRVADLECGKDLPQRKEGMILVRGPQVMKGYLNRAEETAKVMRGDWMVTGDLGFLDEDGFLTITGRLSQFSKIGGEMVPHLAVERAIRALTKTDELNLAVTAAPDSARGEKLVVLYSDTSIVPAAVVQQLNSGALPRLWIPDARNFAYVSKLPVLATGKIDLKQIRQIASTVSTRSKDDRIVSCDRNAN